MKECVVSIHGINTTGEWQDKLKAVLSEHFEYIPYKYEEFSNRGEMQLVLGPGWRLHFALVALILLLAVVLKQPLCVALILPVVIVGFFQSRKVRGKIITRFIESVPLLRPAHVIAHSLGTYIAGTALRQFHAVTFGRVVFLGAVLSRRYGWNELIRCNGKKFVEVRNEVAGRDFVTRLAWLLHGLIPGMGHAGVRGFSGDDMVHTVRDPWRRCSTCGARIHNVFHPWLGHSSFTDTARLHALKFWLPYLWNIDPQGYAQFLSLCCAVAGGTPTVTQGKGKQVQLLTSEWDWCEGGLAAFVKGQIQLRRELDGLGELDRADLDRRVARVIRHTATLVARAVKCSTSSSGGSGLRDLRYLNPKSAVLKAVDRLYDTTDM